MLRASGYSDGKGWHVWHKCSGSRCASGSLSQPSRRQHRTRRRPSTGVSAMCRVMRVPDEVVTITARDSALARRVTTEPDGTFVVPNLAPGTVDIMTIDGADNNDDVVGGPLQNVTQEAVQEFQIATDRFTAESGRSASSTINVVTKAGTDTLRGSASLFARDRRWQALPPTYDRSLGDEPPFDRQQFAASLGGPATAERLFWFGAVEYRN